MCKKHQLDCTVVSNKVLNSNYFLLTVNTNESLAEVKPGQFVEMRIDNTPNVFLRRPISIHDIDIQNNLLYLLIQNVGEGTNWLSERKKGDLINILLPLGNGFDLNKAPKSALLIGGGVGIAPLLLLGRKLKDKGCEVKFLLGFRSSNELIDLSAYELVGEVLITTEDGSVGEKGFVTQHSALIEPEFTKIYTCGPTPMMRAIAAYANDKNIACQVSLENKMACGLGVCLCCVTETKQGHKCVCSDGPVFDVNDLNW